MYSASIIIAFYNNVSALKAIIHSLENQKEDFEVIIADDGSNSTSQSLLQQLIDSSDLPIQHIWQEDRGFRKNRILNKAVHISQSDYLIFIDGDCIPQHHFVADHIKNKENKYILNGRRVDLPDNFKNELLESSAPELFFKNKLLRILYLYFLGNGKNIEKGFRITQPAISKYLNRKTKGIVGCNFSLFKEDLLSVNGFDNTYEVASIGEDTDIEFRLVNTGISIKNIFFKANMIHLLHPELPRSPKAMDILKETIKNNQLIAKDGYKQAFNEK